MEAKFNSKYLEEPFDKGLKKMCEERYELISLEENAKLRIEGGKDSYVSLKGNWVKEGVIYVPKKGIFLTKNSSVLDNPKKAINAQRNGEEFYITEEQTEKALENSVKIPYDLKKILLKTFGYEKITNFCFGESAVEYGVFLKGAKINGMPLWFHNENYVDRQNSSFARQLWFGDLDYESALEGYYWSLNCGKSLLGVLNDCCENANPEKN